MFHKHPWDFSKQAVKGSLFQEKLKPTFDLGFANTYYPEKYSTPGNINLNSLNRVPFVSITHESRNFEPTFTKALRCVRYSGAEYSLRNVGLNVQLNVSSFYINNIITNVPGNFSVANPIISF